jgi:hypothetical protein
LKAPIRVRPISHPANHPLHGPLDRPQSRTIKALMVALSAVAAFAAALTAGPAQAVDFRAEMEGGALQITIAAGWEENPRLAKDNEVLAFLNPTGLRAGEEIPIWMTIDRRNRPEGLTFESHMKSILAEGTAFGYAIRDSVDYPLSDKSGKVLRSYRFSNSPEGWHRGLGFLDVPGGIVLFRYQAQSEEIWKSRGEGIRAILKSPKWIAG